MRMSGRIAMMMAAVLLAGSLAEAEPRPKHWYKDWKWWVGEAFIAGIRAADVHSSLTARSRCPVCNETNFFLGNHPSDAALVGVGSAGFGIQTTLHILSWKYCPDENSRWWRTASYSLMPGAAAASIPGIVHNYGLTSQPKPASPTAMILGRDQSSISRTAHLINMPSLIERGDRHLFIPPEQFSECGHGLRFCLAEGSSAFLKTTTQRIPR